MNPYSRMMYTLIGALLIWAPAALLTFNGKTDLTQAGLYFLGALLLAYIGTGIISHINHSYRQTAHRLFMAKRQIEIIERRQREEDELKRRSTDNPD